jgi:pimeloyl-ACP methyl ester carboxylesterase
LKPDKEIPMKSMSQQFTPYMEVTGDGDLIVLVHGGWTDGSRWNAVAAELAGSHTAVTYDRRGHSRSPWSEAVTRRTDEDDLAQLIESFELGPAHLVGNSYGGSIVLGTAARYPDLVRTVAVHEPPLLRIADSTPSIAAEIERFERIAIEVADTIKRGDVEAAVALFADDAIFGPGAWSILPTELKSLMVSNAPTFVGMLDDPDWAVVPILDSEVPVLLTDGGQSPAWLRVIVSALKDGPYRTARRVTFDSAGHAPHATHSQELAAVVRHFVNASS